jgi:uncharacterized protein (DUF2141 family)
MKHLIIFLSLSFIIIATETALAGQAQINSSDLVIHIVGFENSTGVAKVALVNSKENYEANTPFKGFNFEIINNEVIKTIALPYGEYAVKAYHDENANNELDTRIFGIPTERYGFSNNARGTFGPPEYDEAAFNLNSPQKEITITLQ